MSADISRLFRDKPKQYRALVRQQGRLPLDSDENHASDIAEWQDEDRFVDTIAPSGSPNDGFRIGLSGQNNPIDFTIGAGSYYLGGSRIECPGGTYAGQKNSNWLGFPLDDGAVASINNARKFLVWLDAREAVVTATEDSELLEPGLGGADTAARKRFSWRVRATPVTQPGCIDAAAQWLAAMQWTTKVHPDTGLLSSGATLTVAFNPADVDQDLCQPSLTPGFLGARNECYRVQVAGPGRYVWGQDDAAPLYRVRVENVSGQPRRIVFLDRPKDEYVRPRAGHTVELLRWDQLLPNRQKTAEAVGAFFTVASGYVEDAITVSSSVDAAWTAWLNGLSGAVLSPADDPLEQRYFYLRVWTGGGAGAQPDIPFATANLPGTGLSLAFSAGAFPGDHWVIAARPNAPARVLPWELMLGTPAHGPRRHVVPLAYVDLDSMTVTDCRRRFRPLFKIGGCCTVTVGDGVSSWGDVSTIDDAIDRLPASGGEICVGPGVYRENIDLTGRQNIRIRGCGDRTRWIAADPAKPLLDLRGCTDISVKALRMEGAQLQCIVATAQPGPAGGAEQPCRRLAFEKLSLAAPSGSAVAVHRVQDLRMRLCRVEAGPFPAGPPPAATSGLAAVYVQGEGLVIERNEVVGPAAAALPSQRPLGGIHVGGNSREILLIRNVIEAGNGNGITLGSVRIISVSAAAWATAPEAALQNAAFDNAGYGSRFGLNIDPAGCINVGWIDPAPKPPSNGFVQVPVSDGVVSDVRIEKNLIRNMGGSGIATFPMFLVLASGAAAQDAVAVEAVHILDNSITGCMALDSPAIPPIQYLFTGFGGIALSMAQDCTIRDNQISDLNPGRDAASCGVFIGYGEDLRIERNRIENTGTGRPANADTIPSGGIFVRLCLGGLSTFGAAETEVGRRDRPALLVQNNVVHAPYGRALKAFASGPVMVTDNRLTGSNPSLFFTNPLLSIIFLWLGGASVQALLADPTSELKLDNLTFLSILIDVLGGDAVQIVNLGLAEEVLAFLVASRGMSGETKASQWMAEGRYATGALDQGPHPLMMRGGETMFANNQVSLQAPGGQGLGTLSSVFILTRDDLCFADNQLEVEADVRFALADAILLAATVRAQSNRMQEAALCPFSMMSYGTGMNNTTNNQVTFILGAAAGNPGKLVSTPNTSLFIP
jgi:predicted RNA-binding protein with TRAM domain